MIEETINALEKLSKYGLVKSAKAVNSDVVTIVLTDGFSCVGKTYFDFLKDCTTCFPEHKILNTCITEKDFAFVVLVK